MSERRRFIATVSGLVVAVSATSSIDASASMRRLM